MTNLRFFDQDSSAANACQQRRQHLAKKHQLDLKHIGHTSFDHEQVRTYNTENLIGATQVPLGVTSPLLIQGQYAQGSFHIPLATTEKSLVAGISRGCKAITQAGGATTLILQDHMTRAPIFLVDNLPTAQKTCFWLQKNLTNLQKIVEEISQHIRLQDYDHWIVGRNFYLRLQFTTGDAMGMNAVTKATQAIANHLEQNIPGLKHLSVSGNMCIDKKPAALNYLLGRGKSLSAEVILSPTICQTVLKTTPKDIQDVNYRKNLVGSARAMSLGFNTHFANMIAALYIATGQDPAQVVEGSLGLTLMEIQKDGNLHASVTLPAIEVATVGGGTMIDTQKEALELLGCAGSGQPPGANARKLSEITAALVLAGELSLLAAETTHTLAKSHEIKTPSDN